MIDRHTSTTPHYGPTYFLTGLVPRFLWPEKPSLSQGSVYAIRFCDRTETDIIPGRAHSASITLLGEPLAEAGIPGMLVGMATVFVALGALSWGAWFGGFYTRSVTIALLPWLADFDQSLSFYIANSTKAALYMCGILGVIKLGECALRRRR